MNSTDPYTRQDDLGHFIADSDSIAIGYTFAGENGAINVNIENKSTKAIYIDWATSRVMLDNNPEKSFIYGDYLSSDSQIDFVYPQRSCNRKVAVFDDYNFHKVKGKFEPKLFLTTSDTHVSLPTRTFSEADSPLFFTSE